MVNAKRRQAGLPSLTFLPRIYPVGRLSKMNNPREMKDNMIPTINGAELDVDSEVIEEFKNLLDQNLENIFTSPDFEGEVTPKKCGYCPFIGICTS